MDNETVKINGKQKVLEKYNKFYIQKMDWLYKGILKNYSIKLADAIQIYDSTKEWIYTKIFYTLEEYIQKILSLKIENYSDEFEGIKEEYERFQSFTVGKLDTRDNIEKNMVLLGISRKLFTHSIPLIVAEQCYEKLLKDARILVQDTKIANKREKAYGMLINLIEDYNVKLLSTKVFWQDLSKRDEYKKFWDKYQKISKLKETDFIEYVKDKFHLQHLKYSKNTNKMIHTIAICGGSAADDLEILTGQVDCYITGDTKYRHAKYAIDHDCLLIDPGHHLEVIIEEKLPELLEDLPIQIQIHESLDYFKYE